jgi:para-nitrobenzyl esterase
MPYAAPPTGANRWRPPQPREPYDGPLDATAPGGSCAQDVGSSTARFTTIPTPEDDCLTLNVWAPDGAEGLPVMFWIHGGGLRAGSAHQPYYVGDDLASEGVVVVSANYRLGAFGFLATDELADESNDGSYGNYGVADQAAALEWVQNNIAAFGGDPENVTIFGESAGGGSVCAHLASPGSEGLFDRAIIESGGGCDNLQDGAEAQAAGAAFLEAVGCDDIACMREVPTEAVLAAEFDANFVADGVLLSETGRERAEAGELEGIEVITGSNANEAFLFTITVEEPTADELVDLVREVTDDSEALLALYPAADYESNLERYRTLLTDVRFTCPTLAFAEVAQNDTYVYNYTYVSPDSRFGFGPTHGAELAFLFAHPEGISGLATGLTGTDARVSADMQAAWVAFATNGDPGDSWQPYDDGGQVTVIDAPVELVDEIRGGRCDEVTELVTIRR